jgi:hypothetical protein
MTAIAVVNRDLANMSDTDLMQELVKGLQVSADSLMYLARVWAELEKRGQDLSALRSGPGYTISLIAAGRLAAEAVVAFMGRPSVLQSMEGLPLERQRELANGATLEVYDPDRRAVIKSKVDDLPQAVIRKVVAGGRELDVTAQRLAISARNAPPAKASVKQHRVTVNPIDRTVKVGNMRVTIEEVLAAFAMAASDGGITDEELQAKVQSGVGVATASCHLSEEEDQRFKAACKARNVERGEAVRRAVVSLYLL